MKKELIGTEAPLNKGGSHSMVQDGPTGHPMKQLVGTEAPDKNTPFNLMPINETREGTRQIVGTKAPCSYTPTHGWESYPTPMSERSIKQSK